MRIIDTFPFFNEFELLELRLRLLDTKVDHFVISELDFTHSGLPKEFSAAAFVKKIGMSHKVSIRELSLGKQLIEPIEMDLYHAQLAGATTPEVSSLCYARERLQRDAIKDCLSDFPTDSIIIHSDCDEIIRPDVLDYVARVKNQFPENIIKIPLVQLEGRADLRLYLDDTPVPWSRSLYVCTASQMNSTTPTVMRANYANPFQPLWITQDGSPVEDLGWHFTWMGDAERVKKKASSVVHWDHLRAYKGQISNRSTSQFTSEQTFDESRINAKPYPLENIPKVILENKHLRSFFLPF